MTRCNFTKIIMESTVKPVNKDPPRKRHAMVFIKSGLYLEVLCFIQSMKGYQSMTFNYMMVFIGRWSLTQV